MEDNLDGFICTMPFRDLSIYNDKEQYFCCKEWLDVSVDFDENGWNGETATQIREEMLNGSFKYCSSTNCPHLSTLKKLGRVSTFSPIIKKSEFLEKYKINPKGPKNVRFTFDAACNLACPSCRRDFIPNSTDIDITSENVLDKVYEFYGNDIENVTLSGYGDPFYSNTMMKFLKDVDSTKLPKLKGIHLHTNAILWNQRNWEKIKKSHKFISSAEISIDAATKETYKDVRVGGNWDSLIKNIEFINEIEEVKNIIVSFVIQTRNYKEMVDFYHLFNKKLNKKNLMFQYHSIQDWGVMNTDEYKKSKIWDKTHPLNSDFLIELESLKKIDDYRIVISID